MRPRRAQLVWIGDGKWADPPWPEVAGLPLEARSAEDLARLAPVPTVLFAPVSWMAEHRSDRFPPRRRQPLILVSDGDPSHDAGWAALLNATDMVRLSDGPERAADRVRFAIDLATLAVEHALRRRVCQTFRSLGLAEDLAPAPEAGPVLLYGASSHAQMLAGRVLGPERRLAFAENVAQAQRHLRHATFAAVVFTDVLQPTDLEAVVGALRSEFTASGPRMILLAPMPDTEATTVIGIDDWIDVDLPIEWARLRLHGTIAATDLRAELLDAQAACGRVAVADGISGAASVAFFNDYLTGAVRGASATRRVVLGFELEGFAAFNERSGFAMGDRLLRDVAECLAISVRAEDLVGRLGGASFAISLTDVSESRVPQVLNRIRHRLNRVVEGAAGPRLAVRSGWVVSGPDETAVTLITRLKRELAGMTPAPA